MRIVGRATGTSLFCGSNGRLGEFAQGSADPRKEGRGEFSKNRRLGQDQLKWQSLPTDTPVL